MAPLRSIRAFRWPLLAWIALLSFPAYGQDADVCSKPAVVDSLTEFVVHGEAIVACTLEEDPPVFNSINEAVADRIKRAKPVKTITAHDKTEFPSYSACERPFFRVVTIPKEADRNLLKSGWKSGWDRGEEGNAFPPSTSISERIIQYVGVKGENRPFPRNSTIVGIMEDPVRTLSVGWHTGYTTDASRYMRMDEIEIGPCAKAPECQEISAVDSSETFRRDQEERAKQGKKLRFPRYSTEGEWAVDRSIPASCVVSTYRIRYQKVDDVRYTGSY